jgi:hypothetical protein
MVATAQLIKLTYVGVRGNGLMACLRRKENTKYLPRIKNAIMKRSPLKRKPYKLITRKPLRAKRQAIRKVSPRRKENLEVTLWTAFSLYIRERDSWTCFTCGNYHPRGSGMMQAGHYHP